MSKERLPYEPPQARDLSALSASGQQPMYQCSNGLIAENPGACTGGGQAADDCAAGLFFDVPGPCTPGSGPPSGECLTGLGASNSQCTSGNIFGPPRHRGP